MMNHPVIQRGSKTVIAMAHVPALPGAPDYDSQMGMQKLHDWVARDVEALQTGGVDAIMFGNEFDSPYVLKAPPEGLAALTAVVTEAREILKVPFGVNYLGTPWQRLHWLQLPELLLRGKSIPECMPRIWDYGSLIVPEQPA